MRNKKIVGFVFFQFILSFSLNAQEKQEQPSEKFELQKLYIEQKLDRTVSNLCAFITTGIAFTKSLGKTPEDYGQFIGETFAPLWEGMKGKGIRPFLQGMYRNLQPDNDFQMEILSDSKASVEGKMNRFGEATVIAFAGTGVTGEEYDRCFAKLWESITNYLGLEYMQKVEGEWILFTISDKTFTAK